MVPVSFFHLLKNKINFLPEKKILHKHTLCHKRDFLKFVSNLFGTVFDVFPKISITYIY